MWKIDRWQACIILLIATLLLMVIILSKLIWPHKTVIYKAMNYNQYLIVIISKTPFINFCTKTELYADIWLDGNKTKSYYLFLLDAFDEYDFRIKDITTLPDEGVIKVEFTELEYSKSKTGVDLYKIE